MKLEMYWIGGAFFLLRINGKCSIGCDPFLNPEGTSYDFRFFKSTRVREPVYDSHVFRDVSLWLLTHAHADHVDERGIALIHDDAEIVTERSVMKFLCGKKRVKITRLNWGESSRYVFGTIRVRVRAVHAYHGSNFISRMFAGKVNGYRLDIEDGNEKRTVYITSDTVYHRDIVRAVGDGRIDLMIANMGEVMGGNFGGPLTMSVEMLARFCDELRPTSVIPVHIDDFSHYKTKRDQLAAKGFNVRPCGCWIDLI
jgi:L-ascorbate metabolism protein UlaG (beta-lactamase superfamily)